MLIYEIIENDAGYAFIIKYKGVKISGIKSNGYITVSSYIDFNESDQRRILKRLLDRKNDKSI